MAEFKKKYERTVDRLGQVLALPAVIVGGIVGYGFLEGNAISSAPNVDVALERILEPRATKIGRVVLEANKNRNNNIIITRPDEYTEGRGEIVSLESWTTYDWVTIDATMFRDKNGQLDPKTTNDVDIHIRGCDEDRNICGGNSLPDEEIEIIYGDNDTFTEGNWGVQDKLKPPGYAHATLTVSSATKSPTEVADTPDAQHALKEARVFSKLAQVWTDEALRGQVKLPEPKKSD